MTTTQAAQIAGGTWTIDTNHSLIEFAARHNEIAYVKGRFRKFSGTINVDEKDLLKSQVELTIDTTSVESQAVQGREDLINGEEMLDTAKYPQIRFRSTAVRVREGGEVLQRVDLDRGGFACALGGSDRSTLFIMATEWNGPEQMFQGPRTGQVLSVEAPAPGVGWP